MRTFVTGGARSGKSSLATRWALERSQDVCCLVTAALARPGSEPDAEECDEVFLVTAGLPLRLKPSCR
jgi:adenosyl cobinamide kinase/adenosyl cobinamide phosphate guanylyltransferase